MRFGGFDWDSGNLPKCLGHGVSLAEIEAMFAGDVFVVGDSVVAGALVTTTPSLPQGDVAIQGKRRCELASWIAASLRSSR